MCKLGQARFEEVEGRCGTGAPPRHFKRADTLRAKPLFVHTDERGAIMGPIAGEKRKRYDLVCKADGLIAALEPYSGGTGSEDFISSSLLNFKIRIERDLPES